jgi:hypothetical protein
MRMRMYAVECVGVLVSCAHVKSECEQSAANACIRRFPCLPSAVWCVLCAHVCFWSARLDCKVRVFMAVQA